MNRQTPSNQTPASRNRFGNVSRSIKEIYAELGRVTWPTKEETFRLSIMVVVVSVSVGIFLGLVDLLFTEVFDVILGRN